MKNLSNYHLVKVSVLALQTVDSEIFSFFTACTTRDNLEPELV